MRYIVGYGYLAVVFLVVMLAGKLFRLSVEVSRKIAHILIGFTWVILYYGFITNENALWFEVLVMPVTFILVNYLSYRYKIFTFIEREGEKNHPGTVYYAIAMTVLMTLTIFFPATVIPSGIAVFCLSFGDGAASLIGSFFGKYGPRITKTKSLIGSLACAVGAIAGVYLMMLFVPFSLPFYAVVIIGVTTAACELVGYGMDIFAIVFGVTAISTLLMGV